MQSLSLSFDNLACWTYLPTYLPTYLEIDIIEVLADDGGGQGDADNTRVSHDDGDDAAPVGRRVEVAVAHLGR